MKFLKDDFNEGIKDIAPILVGVIPFGMISGIATIDAGFSKIAAIVMSFFIFAGASQLVVVQLVSSNATLLVIIGTALIVNLRFIMYSASLAPHFQDFPRKIKWLLSYFLTDQSFALSVSRYVIDTKINRFSYYLGNSILLWLVWQLSTIAGIFLGSSIPKEWGLDFAIPLTFMVLLIKSIEDSATLTAASVGGIVAVVARSLPFNLGLIIAALAGVAAGLIVELRRN